MAVDEAVFRMVARGQAPPTLRFYGWRFPALSIGCFQDYEKEVDGDACRRFGVEVVRRPTGGKAVLHEHELTYAVAAAANPPLFSPDILETYRRISSCIAEGLARIGIRADMEETGRHAPEGALGASCFSSPSRYELVVNGRKICGSAQMRSRGALMQHGSLLTAFDPLRTSALMLPHREGGAERLRNAITSVHEQARQAIGTEHLCQALLEGFEAVLGIRFRQGSLTPGEEELRDHLLSEKYGSESWNIRGRKNGWISGR